MIFGSPSCAFNNVQLVNEVDPTPACAWLTVGGVGFQIIRKFSDVVRREILFRNDENWRDACNANRREIRHRIVFERGIQRRCCSMRSHLPHDQGVAITRHASDFGSRRRTTGTGNVFNHNLLAQCLRHVFRHDACDHIRRSASGKRHHGLIGLSG